MPEAATVETSKLKNRDRSEYQMAILEVAGSSLSTQEIWILETHWKDKLQTRKMGLNSNQAALPSVS